MTDEPTITETPDNALAPYTLRDLVYDLEYCELCFRRANEHGDEAKKPEHRIVGLAAKGTVAAHHIIAASELQDAACERQREILRHPAVGRVRTYCAVLGEAFDSRLLSRMFAATALAHDTTLDDLLGMELGEATALLPRPEQLKLPRA